VRAFSSSFFIVGAIGVIGCTQTVEPPKVRSLVASGKTSLVCWEMNSGEGRDMRACPDSDDALGDDEERHTLALITQTERGEVAVVDMHPDEGVLDQDPSVPGTEHLTVGAMPTGIVSTPGGTATFVGVGEAGRYSIFALPTTCVTPPKEGQPAREITLWSSCRLPSAPGEMVIAVDPSQTVTVDKEDNKSTSYRSTCAPAAATDWIAAANLAITKRRKDCPANLEAEQQTAPIGRRKLVVTLPDEGKIAIFDAQAILNLPPGSFDDCVPDRVVALSTTVPSDPIEQPIPADLVPASGCEAAPPRYVVTPDDQVTTSMPAGIALAGSKLYVSDLGVPLVHSLDLSDPCLAKEEEPLRPLDYDSPGRTVRTRDVAVSELMPSGKRYAYALDDETGSAMVFDISPGTTSRAPVVRTHVPELPFEAPDRISFASPISDLLLVKHDVPAAISPTETAEVGVICDPNPAHDKARGALYRTSSDYTEGAAPMKLRGLFGMAALESGQIGAIDIEDWDAPCRRPATNNPNTKTVDWLGCTNDPGLGTKEKPYTNGDSTFTVTDEASCNVIEPHRLRAGKYFLTNSDYGANAANLESLPILSGGTTESVSTATVDRDKLLPKMLAVPFEDVSSCSASKPLATVPFTYVGTTKYLDVSTKDAPDCGLTGDSVLETDPALAMDNSLLLPLREPRVYAGTEDFSATYEGVVVAQRENGQLPTLPARDNVDGLARALADDELLLRDGDAWFCDQGVQDYDVTYREGQDLGLSGSASLSTFASNHGDFVVLMSDFDEDDPYFKDKGLAKRCNADNDVRQSCEEWFGTSVDPRASRELSIREAYHNQLVLTPRPNKDEQINEDERAKRTTIERIHCCFPAVHKYEVRAANQWVVRGSRLLHDIIPGAGLRCVKDCSPRSAKKKNRVFEVSSKSTDCIDKGDGAARPNCFIGPIVTGAIDEVCTVSSSSGGVKPSSLSKELAEGCVFDSLKGRFAIYRGLEPSTRDMSFTWKVTGGFTGMGVSLVSTSTGQSVMPEHMIYSESLDALVVIDGVSGGLNLFGLEPFASLGQPYL
jgi:hypothetical protein